jgi:hypothetical protein
MIKLSYRYSTLCEVPGDFNPEAYKTMVNPLEYDFCLDPDVNYLVIGIVVRRGTTWLYVVPENKNKKISCAPAVLLKFYEAQPLYDIKEISIIPAVLFDFCIADIPTGMTVKVTNNGQYLEILPQRLASIEGWYERYLNDDPEIISIVELEVQYFLQFNKYSIGTSE